MKSLRLRKGGSCVNVSVLCFASHDVLLSPAAVMFHPAGPVRRTGCRTVPTSFAMQFDGLVHDSTVF